MERLLVVGCSHHRTPITIRERLAVEPDGREAFLGAAGRVADGNVERVLLSTCNRVELYLAASNPASLVAPVIDLLAIYHHLLPADLEPYAEIRTGRAAAEHLFAVAVGLDSLVTGEPQILGQVARAYQQARAAEAAGPYLAALFEAAVRTGKRARTETGISRSSTSVPSIFVSHLAERLGGLAGRTIVVLGAGEMAHAAGRTLKSQGARRIVVVNRTLERAEHLAEELAALAVPLEQLSTWLDQADAILCATSAPEPILTARHLARRSMPGRTLFIADIGVPRNVALDVAGIAGVALLGLDDVQAIVERGMAARAAETPRVQEIIAEELAGLELEYRSLAVRSTIRALHEQADALAERELARTLRALGSLPDDQVEAIRVLAHSIATKLMHAPTEHLRQSARQGDGAVTARWLEEAFGLSGCRADRRPTE